MDTSESSSTAPTAAQLRAEARRRKILEQGEQRINKILGVNADSTPLNVHPRSHSDDITSPWQGTTGYNCVQSSSQSDKVQEQESTPQTAFFHHDKPAMATHNRSFTLQEGQGYIELKRLLLIMAAASIGSFFVPNIMVSFFVFEPFLFILYFISMVKGKGRDEYGDLELTHPNRTMKQLAYSVLADLIVFLFASIVTFAMKQLYL